MDANVKISVTMEIPGATRHFSFMRRKKITMQDTSVDVLPEKLANKIVGTAKYPEYEYVNAKKHINMCREAYEYMTSEQKPDGYFGKPWKKLNRTQRLEWHLEELAKQFNAKSVTYVILEHDEDVNWRLS